MENKVLKAIEDLNKRFDHLENKVDHLTTQATENTQMLKSLIHASEVHKADIDKITVDVAHVKGDTTTIRNDLTTVETITASNYADIVKLKSVKNK